MSMAGRCVECKLYLVKFGFDITGVADPAINNVGVSLSYISANSTPPKLLQAFLHYFLSFCLYSNIAVSNEKDGRVLDSE